MAVTRRGLIRAAGAAGAGAVAAVVAGCSAMPGTLLRPAVPGVRLESGTVNSPLASGEAQWHLAIPESATALVVALHGRGGSAKDWFAQFDGAEHSRRTRLAIASIDGGEWYWHRRRDGVDTEKLVLDTLLGIVQNYGVSTARIGFTGLSMGGYGALLLATRRASTATLGVAAMSPALWRQAGDSAPGAFDDADDFRAHDVWTQPRLTALRRLPIWLAIGNDDPFATATHAYARVVRAESTDFGPGGHDDVYWKAHWGAGLDFLASQV